MGLFWKTVYEGSAGLLFENGRLNRALPPGRYLLPGKLVSSVNIRPTQLAVAGQEATTSDGAAVRLTLILLIQVVDPILNYRSGQSADAGSSRFASGTDQGQIHTAAQVAVREWVMTRTLEIAMEQRASLVDEIQPLLSEAASKVGVEIMQVALVDFNVTGGLKAAMADLLKADVEGRAALARARNEASVMRSLINTARLTREHPGLLELRILSSGQKPRVTFSIQPTSGIAETNVASEAD